MTAPINAIRGLQLHHPQFGRPGMEWLWAKEYESALTAEVTLGVSPSALIALPLEFPRPYGARLPLERPFDQGLKAELVSRYKLRGYHGAPVKVQVDHRGLAALTEGEVRASAAAAAGLQQIPVHIQYYGRSEGLNYAWNPAEIFAPRGPDLVWDPLQVASIAWFAADTIAPVDTGTSIAQWNDLGPFHRHVLNGTQSAQPTYIANAKNGLAALQFDGVTQLLASATFQSVIHPVTVFCALKFDALLTGNPGPWSLSNTNLIDLFAGTNGSGRWAMFAGAELDGSPYDTNWHIHTCVFNSSNSFIRTDGVQTNGNVGSGSFGQKTTAQIVFGAFATNGSHIVQCKIGEWFAAPGVVDPITISRAEHYLSQRWAIANL